MGQINIYKIATNKRVELVRQLSQKLDEVGTIRIERELKENSAKEPHQETLDVSETPAERTEKSEVVKEYYNFTLYISSPQEQKEINWNWLLDEFNQRIKTTLPNPKSVLLIQRNNDYYCVTFGFAYFLVDKYCDRNFAFNFARKLKYKEVKTTALTTPNSQKNKSINTYVNYNDFEFDSGESFTKIKAKVEVEENSSIFKEGIEIGNSIKFNIVENSLEKIVDLIMFIEDVMVNSPDQVKIPVFSKVIEDHLIDKLNMKLKEAIKEETYIVNFSEIDIIGTNETFNHNDSTYKISYKSKHKTIESLTQEELHKFAKENKFNLNENILDIKVVSFQNGNPVRTDFIKDLIDYTDDEERSLLSKGQWFKFNDDYLNYLEDSISEIETTYDPEYDFDKNEHKKFIDSKFILEKGEVIYQDLTEKEIKKKLKNKYYSEKYYNINLQEKFGFVNYDRDFTRVGTATIEEMDLYKDGTIYAVKIGNSSGKLSYVVDQSLQTLKIYKHKMSNNNLEIKEIGLWIILDRKTKLPIISGKPNINHLDMLILKNKIDHWKKEVRLLGYKPVIRINYVI
ncbi:hypothetical protein FHE72_01940 [Rossellomorea vietnamensis]|uniref:Sporadically distributed protein, TIGR04141 family n=1 Tax=Rossellomorea vietnamensis TaxID=218284 RepID=A0A6I6UB50_9BACI|nr:DUF6119 family protein [Rossellomorea vietnamensis]QHE59924.1 hypothetical protein FHE72_01940 [Rossellomorea vietnamensis]